MSLPEYKDFGIGLSWIFHMKVFYHLKMINFSLNFKKYSHLYKWQIKFLQNHCPLLHLLKTISSRKFARLLTPKLSKKFQNIFNYKFEIIMTARTSQFIKLRMKTKIIRNYLRKSIK